MAEPEAEPTESLFLVFASLVRDLARSGLVNSGTFDMMRIAFSMQAETTPNAQKRANCSLAAEYAELLAITVAEDAPPSVAPHLRLVRDDEGDPES
jgi:hypothetical protein